MTEIVDRSCHISNDNRPTSTGCFHAAALHGCLAGNAKFIFVTDNKTFIAGAHDDDRVLMVTCQRDLAVNQLSIPAVLENISAEHYLLVIAQRWGVTFGAVINSVAVSSPARAKCDGPATYVLFVAACTSYAIWLKIGGIELVSHTPGFNLTFNSMLEHLLHGTFDVDSEIIGLEGFARGGRVYAYWGPLFALLRLPLVLIQGGLQLDVTGFSCLIAVALAALVKIQTLRAIFRRFDFNAHIRVIYWTLVLTVLFGGAQITFLKVSLYQEVCLWSGLLGAIFVLCAIRGILSEGFSASLLCVMALSAGAALLARVSIGIGLYAALGLLLLTRVFQTRLDQKGYYAELLGPMLILSAFALAAGFVNYQRWGNALTFADYRFYLSNVNYPDRLARTADYGLFNLVRIPFGIIYYFLPIWIVRGADGLLLFNDFCTRLMEATELPPGSFLLTDVLLLGLGGFSVWYWFVRKHKTAVSNPVIVAIDVGLACPGMLMLCAIAMSHRYRVDFYPLIEFSAWIGVFSLLKTRFVRCMAISRAFVIGAVTSIVFSHLSLLLYKLSGFGPGNDRLRHGFLLFYTHQLERLFPSLVRWL